MSRRSARTRRAVPAESVLVFSPYEPRDAPVSPTLTPRSAQRVRTRGRGVSGRRKETFVEANARFALRPGSDTLMEISSASSGTGSAAGTGECPSGINWEDVECVFVERENDAPANAHECPISLHTLTAPKITPCGHVFSHVSLLQHVAHSYDDLGNAVLDDRNTPVKCPLCSTFFTLGELKDVAFRQVSSLRVGSTCSMRLVSSYQDIVQPYYNNENGQNGQMYDISRNVEEIDVLFSRFCVVSKHFLCDLFTKWLSDLRQALVEDPSLKRYVDVASKHIRTSKQAVHRARKQNHEQANAGTGADSSEHGCSAGSSKRDISKMSSCSASISGNCNQDDSKASSTEAARVFYQASDARNVFLHPINYRCLAHEYGSDMRQAEHTLSAKVLEVERHTMDETARRRYRFLRHLPNGCVFALVELDLSETLKPETLSTFARELDARRAGRKQKRARDRKEDESAGKQRDQALHAYFRLDRAQARPIAPTHDDEDTFPTLSGTSPGASTRAPVNVPGTCPGPTNDPTVTSYSSVTTNMGLFPALAATENSGSQQPQMGTTPPRGAWAAPTALTHTPTSSSPPRQAVQRRHGRTRYTKVLSNAGTTHRK